MEVKSLDLLILDFVARIQRKCLFLLVQAGQRFDLGKFIV